MLRLLAGFLILLAAAPAQTASLEVRRLPTAVQLWRWNGTPQSLLAGKELLYVAGKGRVTALDPRDGKVVWSTVIGTEAEDCGCGHGAHVEVGDRLFVPIAESVAVIDTLDGVLITRAHLGGTVHRVIGPPVLAQADKNDRSTLVRFDERSGAEIARLELPSLWELERFGSRFTATLASPDPQGSTAEPPAEEGDAENSTLVLGLDDQLQITWRRRLEGPVSREGNRLIVTTPHSSRDITRHPIDPETGEVSAELDRESQPARGSKLECPDGSDQQAMSLRVARRSLDDESSVSLPGKDGWSADLPGRAQECVRSGERLILRLGLGTSRDLLAVLRARTGERENILYLPPSVTSLVVARGRLILEMREGLVGVDPLDTGLSEGETHSLAESVADVLSRGATVGEAETIAAELESLGAEALPIAVAALPHLDGEPLKAVAELAGKRDFRSAAAPLAAALDRVQKTALPATADREESARRHRSLEAALALVVAQLAGPTEVTTVARYASRESPAVCGAAMAALGRIGTEASIVALDRALAAARPSPGRWFRPPNPPRLGALTPEQARDVFSKAQTGDSEDYADVTRALRSSEVAIGTRKLLVFPALRHGFGDYWITENPSAQTAAREEAAVFYLGHLGACEAIHAHVEHGVLRIACDPLRSAKAAGGGVRELRLPLDAWAVDSDGDGLTDLLERHLGLDPTRSDSNGNGIPDGLDRSPNATPARPLSATDQLALTALETFWACDPWPASPVLFLTGTPALDWRGRSGATITLAPGDIAERGLGSGYPAWRVEVDGEVPVATSSPPLRPLAPGERRVVVTLKGPWAKPEESRWGVAMTLSRAGDRWIVTRIDPWDDFEFDPESE